MSELRAPDPTLTSLPEGVGVAVEYDASSAPPTAHAIVDVSLDDVEEPETTCGAEWHRDLDARDAAWFAVPCRECFPAAPPPGEQPCKRIGCTTDHGRYLAWQVPS